MNTFWLKIAGAVVAVVGIIILVKAFLPKSEPKPEPKTVYDVWQKDDKRLRAEPQLKEPAANSNQPVRPQGQQPVTPQTTTVEPPKPQFKQLTRKSRSKRREFLKWLWLREKWPGCRV